MISNKFGLAPFGGGKEPFHIPITTTGAAFAGYIESFATPYTRYVFSDGQVVTGTNAALNVTFSGAATRNNKFYVKKTNAKIVFLTSKNLAGDIPDELVSLSNLTYLSLSTNQFTGIIPTGLGSLSNLQYLYLQINQLTGGIPTQIGSLSNLLQLYLNNNPLGGSIPSELGSLSNLQYLSLHTNQLTGGIPTQIGSLSNLQYLYLYTNQFSGSVPSQLGSLSNLIHFYLNDNQLTGYEITSIPLTCTIVRIQNNLLPQSAVDAVIASVYSSLASRPTTGNLNVGGTGNAAPSATGISQAADIATHGWTVTHNV